MVTWWWWGTAGRDDLKALFQPQQFHGSMLAEGVPIITCITVLPGWVEVLLSVS